MAKIEQESPSQSTIMYKRALEVLPGGVSRNTVFRQPHPIYADFAQGCLVTDIEGVTRVDFANNMASLIHGHAHPAIVDAVSGQLRKGTAYALATEVEIHFAEELRNRNAGFEKLRFVNSGTEAVMCVLKAARAFTGRAKIAKVEGSYHGQYDYAEVSQTASPDTWGDLEHPKSVPVAQGTPTSALADVIVIPFNDPKRAVAILDENARDLACVLLDLMPHRVGLNPADQEYVQILREWTTAHDTLLVLDEVITFRSAFSGLQANYAVTPDLTALGKIIGGGFAVGAIAGRSEVMDVMNPLAEELLFPHSGTFSANPVTMTAGLVAMQLYDEPSISRLNALAKRAKDGINDAIRATGITACVTGYGSMFRIHLKPTPPRNYRELFMSEAEAHSLKILVDYLFTQGMLTFDTCTAVLSTPMEEPEIDRLVGTLERGFAKLVRHPPCQ